jgi:hypothetical protein
MPRCGTPNHWCERGDGKGDGKDGVANGGVPWSVPEVPMERQAGRLTKSEGCYSLC